MSVLHILFLHVFKEHFCSRTPLRLQIMWWSRTPLLDGRCLSSSERIRQHNSSSAQRPNSPQARSDRKAAFQIMRPVTGLREIKKDKHSSRSLHSTTAFSPALKWKLDLMLKMHAYFTDCFFQRLLGGGCFFSFFLCFLIHRQKLMEPPLAAAAALWGNIERALVLLVHRESPPWRRVGTKGRPVKAILVALLVLFAWLVGAEGWLSFAP